MNYILTPDGELYHHGVNGQKWGVRRYQNKDGTLTPRGKKRYADDGPSSKKPSSDNKSSRGSGKRIQTAEKEYTGDKLKKSADEYRNKMLRKYTGKDPKKTAFYTNASDEVIQEEFVRRKNVKKAIIAGAAVVGVGAACVIAYRMSANKKLQSLSKIGLDGVGETLKKTTDADVKNALKTAAEDLDYCIPEGSEIHRMVGSSGFDLSKTIGKRTYVTTNDADRAAYALFLKDWGGTGERWDVTLKATKDIVAPNDERARKIFKEVYDSDPEYRSELKRTITNAYAKVYKAPTDHPEIQRLTDKMLSDPFGAGMYAFVQQGRDSDILTNAYRKAGYNAIVDYFDRGSLGKQPMILFDAAGSTTKVNEKLIKQGRQFVSDMLKEEYVGYLRGDKTHPMRGYV